MEDSDRTARVLVHAIDLFNGDREAALEWLAKPQPALGDVVPLNLVVTEFGARQVEALILRLEQGVFS